MTVLLDKKTWRGIQPGIALPHQGMQERVKRMMQDKKQWLWMVQDWQIGKIETLGDTGKVVATAEKHRHQYVRRLTKKEVIEHLTKVWMEQQAVEQARKQTSKLTNTTEESKPK